MDKRNLALGILCLAAAFGLMFWQSKRISQRPPPPPPAAAVQPAEPTPSGTPGGAVAPSLGTPVATPADAPASLAAPLAAEASAAPAALGAPVATGGLVPPATPALAPAGAIPAAEAITVVANEFLRVEFTSRGGAIRTVEFLQYKAVQGEPAPYRFNDGHPVPLAALGLAAQGGGWTPWLADFTLAGVTDREIAFRLVTAEGLEVVRSFLLHPETEGAKPYRIEHRTLLTNRGAAPVQLSSLFLGLGTAAPDPADPTGLSLAGGVFDGQDDEFVLVTQFRGSNGFLGMFRKEPVARVERERPVVWATVKNQFFVSTATLAQPGTGVVFEPATLPGLPMNGIPRMGVSGSVRLAGGALAPGETREISAGYFIGPKEYARLSTLEQEQDRVMQFGIFGFIAKFLLMSLRALQTVVINWGLAIIFMTILIRLVFWPLTAQAARTSKRMASIQGPIKEINERYKAKLDNSQLSTEERQRIQLKKQKEMMELFQQHKINPLAGCLPMLVQIPIFIAFYYMLRSASELRFAHFLWIQDLSLPDTILRLGGFPLNPLPLLMGVTMYFQMKMTPTPSTDEVQQKILRFMPFIFLIMCYNFSSGLVLYWTVSNLFSILQQVITNRSHERETAAAAPAGAPAKKGKST